MFTVQSYVPRRNGRLLGEFTGMTYEQALDIATFCYSQGEFVLIVADDKDWCQYFHPRFGIHTGKASTYFELAA